MGGRVCRARPDLARGHIPRRGCRPPFPTCKETSRLRVSRDDRRNRPATQRWGWLAEPSVDLTCFDVETGEEIPIRQRPFFPLPWRALHPSREIQRVFWRAPHPAPTGIEPSEPAEQIIPARFQHPLDPQQNPKGRGDGGRFQFLVMPGENIQFFGEALLRETHPPPLPAEVPGKPGQRFVWEGFHADARGILSEARICPTSRIGVPFVTKL